MGEWVSGDVNDYSQEDWLEGMGGDVNNYSQKDRVEGMGEWRCERLLPGGTGWKGWVSGGMTLRSLNP